MATTMPGKFEIKNFASTTVAPVKCRLCDFQGHSLVAHIKKEHGMTLAAYLSQFPDAKLMSRKGWDAYQELRDKKNGGNSETSDVESEETQQPEVKRLLPDQQGKTISVNAGRKLKLNHDFKIMVPGVGEVVVDGATVDTRRMVPQIDKDYVFRPAPTWAILHSLSECEPMYMWGGTGTGKSTLPEQVAAQLGWPMIRANFDSQLTREDLLGGFGLLNGSTVFKYGVLPLAMQIGAILLLDEYDTMNPDLAPVFQSVLERKPNGRMGSLTLYTGTRYEIVEPHPKFRIIATGNTNMRGDATGMFSGTMIQNMANKNRFTMYTRLDYMKKEEEIDLLMSRYGLTPDRATVYADVAAAMRAAFDNGAITEAFGTRQTLNWVRIAEYRGDMLYGIELAYINGLSENDAKIATEIVSRTINVDEA